MRNLKPRDEAGGRFGEVHAVVMSACEGLCVFFPSDVPGTTLLPRGMVLAAVADLTAAHYLVPHTMPGLLRLNPLFCDYTRL